MVVADNIIDRGPYRLMPEASLGDADGDGGLKVDAAYCGGGR